MAFSPLDLFRTYGAAVALAAVAVLYVMDLRSDNRKLREDKAALELEVKGLEVEAAKNAAEILRLTEAGRVVDATGAEQESRDAAELARVRSSLSRLEQALADLKTNPTDDGSVGPVVTARLFEQREAAAAILDARGGRGGQSAAAGMPAAPEAAERPADAAGNASNRTGQDGPDQRTNRAVAGRDAGMGPERLESGSGLAGGLAGPVGLSDVEVVPIRCILSDETGKTIEVEQPDGTFVQHTVGRSVKASDGTLTKWRGNWLTAWHVMDGPCIRILIENEPWEGEIVPLEGIDVAVLRWAGVDDCRRPVDGLLTFKGYHLVGGDADAGVYDFDTWSGDVLNERQVDNPVPVAFRGELVKSNSGGAVIDQDGVLVGIAIQQSVDFDGKPLPVGWFTPMSEICATLKG